MRASTGSAFGAAVLAFSMLLGGCSAADTASACKGIDQVDAAVAGLSDENLKTVADYRKKLAEVKANLDQTGKDAGTIGQALVAVLNKLVTELDNSLANVDQGKSLADTGLDLKKAQKGIDDALGKLSDTLKCPS